MDQLTFALGEAGHALLIDCRFLSITRHRIPDAESVVILDTTTRRYLVESAYKERRAAGEQAAQAYGVAALRDLSLGDLERRPFTSDVEMIRRIRHVVTENARTLEAAPALSSGDTPRLGHLMIESHASLRDDYNVSTAELDIMVDSALGTPGCIGARMTGAGFGGCAVALVFTERVSEFLPSVKRSYRGATGLEPRAYVCSAANGASGRVAKLGPRVGEGCLGGFLQEFQD